MSHSAKRVPFGTSRIHLTNTDILLFLHSGIAIFTLCE